MYRTICLISGLAITGVAWGDSCDVTIVELFAAQGDAPNPAAAMANIEAGRQKAEDKLVEQLTSTSLAGADIGGSALNFLPLLSLSGLSGNLEGDTENNDNDNLGFDFNIPLPFGSEQGRELKLAASFNRQPQAFEPLIESLAADQRDEVREALEDDLGIGDDATFSVTYNVNNAQLGRYRGMVGELFGRIVTTVDASDLQPALAAVNDAVEGADDLNVILSEVEFSDPDSGDPLPDSVITAKRTALCEAWKNYQAISRQIDEAENLAVAEANLDLIAKLASNQPQLHATIAVRERAEAVGPDEVSAKVTFEWGYRANLNTLQRHSMRLCVQSTAADCLVNAYASFLAQNEAAIDASDRLTFSLEYADVDDYSLASMDPMFSFQREGSHKIISSVGYGRLLEGSVLDDSRLDLAFKYEDVSDDDTRNNRTVGVLTLTKKFGEMTVPFSVVYSNKPEFVAMESDERLSAHLGIKYEFQTP